MEIQDVINRFSQLPNEIKKAGEDCATKEAAYRSLDNQSKNILARIKSEFEDNSGTTSDNKLERLAHCSHEWGLHAEGKDEAQEKWIQAKAKLSGLETEHRTLQSLISFEKAKANIL